MLDLGVGTPLVCVLSVFAAVVRSTPYVLTGNRVLYSSSVCDEVRRRKKKGIVSSTKFRFVDKGNFFWSASTGVGFVIAERRTTERSAL